MNKLRVGIYTRVSTDEQAREGFSLEVQEEALRETVKRSGWEIVCSIPGRTIYAEEGFTGFVSDRPVFNILSSDARSKLFDVILVYKLDRLYRKLKDLLIFFEEMQSLGIDIKSATEPFDTTTSAGKFLMQMLGSAAEFERNRLVERVFPGMVMGVKKGHWQGSRYAPYGYCYNKEEQILKVVKTEAEIVKQIYDMYLTGNSSSQIAGIFYHQDIPTRSGGKFNTKLICDILRNKVYLGKLVWNRRHYDKTQKTKGGKGYRYVKNPASEVIESDGCHEPIINQDVFERVQARLQRNTKNKNVRFKNNIYYLSGVLYCADCGMKYYGVMIASNHRTGGKKPWYRCGSRSYRYMKKCANPQVMVEKLHSQVWKILDQLNRNFPLFMKDADHYAGIVSAEPDEHYQDQLDEKKVALKHNLEKQEGLFQLYNEDKINIELYKAKADELRKDEKTLKSALKQIELQILDRERGANERVRAQQFLRNLKAKGYKWSDADKKEFMGIIFKKLTVKNGELRVDGCRYPFNLFTGKEEQCQTKEEQHQNPALPQWGYADHSAYNWLPSAAK